MNNGERKLREQQFQQNTMESQFERAGADDTGFSLSGRTEEEHVPEFFRRRYEQQFYQEMTEPKGTGKYNPEASDPFAEMLGGDTEETVTEVQVTEKPAFKSERVYKQSAQQFEVKRVNPEINPVGNPGTEIDLRYPSYKSTVKKQQVYKGSKLQADLSPGKKLVKETAAVPKAFVHEKVNEVQDDNAAVEAAHDTEIVAEKTTSTALQHAQTRVETKLRFTDAEPKTPAEPIKTTGKNVQKAHLKKEYAKAARTARQTASTTTEVLGTKASLLSRIGNGVQGFVRNHAGVIAVLIFAGLLGGWFVSSAGVLGTMMTETGEAVMETTYLSSDDAINETEDAYEELEEALQRQIDNIEDAYPGFDEYRYIVDEITHDPYSLISYLTAKYGNFTLADVEAELRNIFQNQFSMQVWDEVELRHVEEEDPDTGEMVETEETYEWHILNIKVENQGLDQFAQSHLNSSQLTMYRNYQISSGNRSYLFGDTAGVGNVSGGGMSYEIPPEALSDQRFANMIAEAEKYLGYPYVWGGSNPSESFDCSGFVCWVVNHCGNGWNVGRTTAEGLRNMCTYVPASDAKPGDLIFFQGTYNTYGASHVAIYVGNGMMLHCGDPIQYTTINSNYWQQHFYCFGRLS